jgi:predicted DNA-binding protein
MSKTLTVRLDENQREQLRRKARQLGKTDSQLVREILEQHLEERPLATRAGHLVGRLSLKGSLQDLWRKELKAHNWRR